MNQPTANFPASVILPYSAWTWGTPDATAVSGTGWPAQTYNYNFKDAFEDFIDAGSPYATAYSYDPNDELDATEELYDDLAALLAELPTDTDAWAALMTAAADEVDDLLTSDTVIAAEVAAFTTRREQDYARAFNRFAAGMFDHGAVAGHSGFIIGKAQLTRGLLADVAQFDAQLTAQKSREKVTLTMQAYQDLAKIHMLEFDATKAIMQARSELARTRIISNKEYLSEELNLAVEDANWEVNSYAFTQQAIGAVGGMPAHLPGPTMRPSVLGGQVPYGQAGQLAMQGIGLGASLVTGNISSALNMVPLLGRIIGML